MTDILPDFCEDGMKCGAKERKDGAPYLCDPESLRRDLGVSRRYLSMLVEELVAGNFIKIEKVGNIVGYRPVSDKMNQKKCWRAV